MAVPAPLDHPAKSLCAIYALRTLSVLLLAWITTYLFPSFSPLGYDTSSTHITRLGNTRFFEYDASNDHQQGIGSVERLVTALTRWDAIYFASIAKHGYRWEQEWAFGIGQSYLLQGYKFIRAFISSSDISPSSEIFFLSICSCIAHLVSAITLFHLTALLFQTTDRSKGRSPTRGSPANIVPFVAATLHILSPAGIFLIAPYNESIFSALSFLGYYLYSYAIKNTAIDGKHEWWNEIFLLLSGLFFGISCLFRSNGVINGILFVFEVSQSAWRLVSGINPFANLRLFIASGVSGALVSIPFLWRQYAGWLEYCIPEEYSVKREWCNKTLPSIYSYVQSQYWGVGFMKYWTAGNIPLFLLAAPMLFVLLRTSSDILKITAPPVNRLYSLSLNEANRDLLFRLTVPQLLLATMAITNYHVQIITRLSSGLPMWYVVTAAALIQTTTADTEVSESKDTSSESGKTGDETDNTDASWCRPAIHFFLGYQVVQAVLYGGFLPPA
ncbi:ER membrane glycoprotein subunit of the GPI transamidase complex-like protein [Orbilia brochopaga]|uniref:GPI mannosyltransferase 2 n=1 Tax=Orbilia brochopaga TaxID=3140254 RepID=A0AAV9U6B9_9PEZI